MNPSQTSAPAQDRIAPKESYEKPRVTTFGSVAKLTMSGTGTKVDGIHHTRQ